MYDNDTIGIIYMYNKIFDNIFPQEMSLRLSFPDFFELEEYEANFIIRQFKTIKFITAKFYEAKNKIKTKKANRHKKRK